MDKLKIRPVLLGFFCCIFLFGIFAFFNAVFSGESESLPDVAQNVEFESNSPLFIANLDDITFEENYIEFYALEEIVQGRILSNIDISRFDNPETLRNLYTIEPQTVFLPQMFDAREFMGVDFRVNPISVALNEPVVLIFHTHSTEFFVDSNPEDKFTGIVGIGRYLAGLLNGLGIPTLHYTRRFDFIDGQSRILGAYERQEPYIRAILEQYPTIEIIIDLHRDGLPEGAPVLVQYIQGLGEAAQIMLFNGLTLRNVNGQATPIEHLPNPYIPYNLAFSFQMQMVANEIFPGLMRRIFLHAFRYSLHFLPGSLLVEVGAQNNTFEQARLAMHPFAIMLANVIMN